MCRVDPSKVLAVLDWELSTLGKSGPVIFVLVLVLHLLPLLGDPLADASYGCLAHHIASSSGMLSGLKGLDLEALGILTDTQYMEEYCANAGIPSMADTANFYLSFGFFRMAAILQGVYKRSLEGGCTVVLYLYFVIPTVFLHVSYFFTQEKPVDRMLRRLEGSPR